MSDSTKNPSKPESLIPFPCEFPIKIIGKASDAFEIAVLGIIRKHCPNLKENAIQSRASNQGKYHALTVTVFAENQQHLDALYQELTDCELVIMVL